MDRSVCLPPPPAGQLSQKRGRSRQNPSADVARRRRRSNKSNRDDDGHSCGDDEGHDDPDQYAGADLASMSPASRRRYQSRMSSARHRERQQQRIASTTDDIVNLERSIGDIQASIDLYHCQPPPLQQHASSSSNNAGACGSSSGRNRNRCLHNDTGDTPLVHSSTASTALAHEHAGEDTSPMLQSAATDITHAQRHCLKCACASTTTTTSDFVSGCLIGESRLVEKQGLKAFARPSSTGERLCCSADKGCTEEEAVAACDLAAVDMTRLQFLIGAMRKELSRLQTCAHRIGNMRTELAHIMVFFAQSVSTVVLPVTTTTTTTTTAAGVAEDTITRSNPLSIQFSSLLAPQAQTTSAAPDAAASALMSRCSISFLVGDNATGDGSGNG
ncbi:hypothetical protein GGI02_000393 [Coemansia sp. RSA 2322]|nr:hypothetical protein GGI02_000393 [Coemansia sp. RSA 2322]